MLAQKNNHSRSLTNLIVMDLSKKIDSVDFDVTDIGDCTKTKKAIEIPDRLGKPLAALAKKMKMSPGALVAKITLDPLLSEYYGSFKNK